MEYKILLSLVDQELINGWRKWHIIDTNTVGYKSLVDLVTDLEKIFSGCKIEITDFSGFK